MERARTAIVGLGRIASLLEDDPLREKPCTHAGAISLDPDSILAAGADVDPERRALFSERWSCPVYESTEEMLVEKRPQILHIATHPDSHARYCGLAARHGVSVVVCEKPLADSLSAAKKIARLHEPGRFTILTNHERRYAEDYREAERILESGELGETLSVRATLYLGERRRILDVLWHDGTHLADIIRFLSGRELRHERVWGADLAARQGTAFLGGWLVAEPKRKRAVGAGEASASPASGAPDRIPFVIECGARRDHLVFEVGFSCSRGKLTIGNGVFEVWRSEPSPYAQGFRSLKAVKSAFEGPYNYFSNMVRDAVACLRDPGRIPQSSALDGLRAVEYLNSIRAWKSGL